MFNPFDFSTVIIMWPFFKSENILAIARPMSKLYCFSIYFSGMFANFVILMRHSHFLCAMVKGSGLQIWIGIWCFSMAHAARPGNIWLQVQYQRNVACGLSALQEPVRGYSSLQNFLHRYMLWCLMFLTVTSALSAKTQSVWTGLTRNIIPPFYSLLA